MSLASASLDPVQPVDASLQPVARPVSTGERIAALDALRGFALLGILLMNIVGFGLYFSAYDNPTSAGGATGVNLWCWIVLHVLAEGKMRCLFSLVFGASMILFTSRIEGRSDAADIYYRRTLWLLLFGVVHAYLLWQGEILYPYALCGLALYPFRKMSPRSLIIIGALGLLLVSSFEIGRGVFRRAEITEGKAAIAKAERGEKLSDEEKEARDEWEKSVKKRNPSPEDLQTDAKKWQGGFISIIKARGTLVNEWNSTPYYHPYMFDIWGMMFLGMGLMKLGVLGGQRSTRHYALMVAIGYTVGLLVNGTTAAINVRANFDPVIQNFASSVYQIGRLAVTFGHLGVILLVCKTGWLRFLTDRLSAVGQMAFSNYVMHSVICAFLFTGYGFGLYGRLERHQLYYVVAAIWIIQLIASPIWLRHFRFGPLEWGWRSLTYWKRQPFRIAAPKQAS